MDLYSLLKKLISIVLLILVDTYYNFIAVDIGAYGKNSVRVNANSNLGKALQQRSLNVPENSVVPNTDILVSYVIVADEAFLLKD